MWRACGGSALKQEIAPPGIWPDLRDARQRLLLRHWALWRDGLRPPPRSRLDPALLKPCLPDFWIFRIADSGNDLVCTLAGENIRDAWGHSIIGGRPVDLWGAGDGDLVRERLLRAAREPALIHGRTGITPKTGASKLAQRLMLPLCDDAGAAYGVMGMTQFVYDHSRDALPTGTSEAPILFSTFYPCDNLPDTAPDA